MSERCLVFPQSTAFCMSWRTPLLLLPTNSFSLTSKSRHHPPTSYPWYFFNSQRCGPYFHVVFSSSFFSRFVTHGHLISDVMTRFDSRLIMRGSTLLALTSWCSRNRRISQNDCLLFASYTSFGFSGEHQGGTKSTRTNSCSTSKKSISKSGLHYVG